MRFLYSFSIWLISLMILALSPFNRKARQWTVGRRGVFARLRQSIGEGDRVIWFHCASLGEFEQGRPLMESIRHDYPDYKILLTFFSPSGYEVRKNDPVADIITYLPADTARNAARFVRIVRPQVVFFIKYEFWFNYINQLSNQEVPVFVVSAIFRRSQYFFRPWGKWSQRQLKKVTHFFVQNEKSLALLRLVRMNHTDISGDTRFDRVVKIKSEPADMPAMKSFAGSEKVMVAGSTWTADEDLLRSLMDNYPGRLKLVIAPHVVSREHIGQIRQKFGAYDPVLYSAPDEDKLPDARVMIIDSIGLLAHIYRFGHIAYVGGGFGAGIHNTLEAATYGMPVIFGPNYERFQEAVDLRDIGSGFPVKNAGELLSAVTELLKDPQKYEESAASAAAYVMQNAGAVRRIRERVDPFIRGR